MRFKLILIGGALGLLFISYILWEFTFSVNDKQSIQSNKTTAEKGSSSRSVHPDFETADVAKSYNPTVQEQELINSRQFNEAVEKQKAGKPFTVEDLPLILKIADLQGKRIPEPKLYKYTEYPPTTPEGKAMWNWWHQMQKADPDFEFKRKINFYGVVKDENEIPISNAEVGLTARGMNGDKSIQLKVNSDGSFKLESGQGKYLYVGVSSCGYRAYAQNFNYAEFYSNDFIVPDPQNPVVFKLRKLTAAETVPTTTR